MCQRKRTQARKDVLFWRVKRSETNCYKALLKSSLTKAKIKTKNCKLLTFVRMNLHLFTYIITIDHTTSNLNAVPRKLLFFTSKYSVLNPTSRYRLLWNLFVFVAILYNATTIPMRLSYQDLWAKNDLYGLYSFDYFFDLVYIIDIVLHMRTAYLNKGVTVTDREKILNHYLRVIWRSFLFNWLTRAGSF